MRYTYDAKKRASNLKKHGYDFNEAADVIESGQTVTFGVPSMGTILRV